MKGYMMDETAKSQVTRFARGVKAVLTAERMEKLLMNLMLDGHIVEVPVEDEIDMQMFISELRDEGWALLTIPDDEYEARQFTFAMKAQGKHIYPIGYKEG